MTNSNHRTIRSILVGLLLWLPAAAMAAPVNETFDHFTTGFPLTGGHRAVECDACHTSGQFRGTPRECSTCHSLLMNTGAVVKSTAHIQTSNDCETCHSTLAWDDVRRVNHMAVLGDCKSCHTVGGGATSVPPSDSIHSGVLSTNTDCLVCHRTSTWASVHYNHALNAAGHVCDDCHNQTPKAGGIAATPPPATPVHSTGAQCDVCHTTHSWTFSHNNVTDPCSSCHNNVIAQGKPGTHLDTLLECNSCHSTKAWIPAGWEHTGPYPDHTFTNLRCNDCHSSSPQTASNAYDDPAYKPYCLACHVKDALKEHSKATSDTKYWDCTNCHEHSNALSKGKW